MSKDQVVGLKTLKTFGQAPATRPEKKASAPIFMRTKDQIFTEDELYILNRRTTPELQEAIFKGEFLRDQIPISTDVEVYHRFYLALYDAMNWQIDVIFNIIKKRAANGDPLAIAYLRARGRN